MFFFGFVFVLPVHVGFRQVFVSFRRDLSTRTSYVPQACEHAVVGGVPSICTSDSDGRSRWAAAAACLSRLSALLFLGMKVLAFVPKRAISLQPRWAHFGGITCLPGCRASSSFGEVLSLRLLFFSGQIPMRKRALLRVVLVLTPTF